MELRKDYVLDRWVIISTGRAARPKEFKKTDAVEKSDGSCFFCPGNEAKTPPEIYRVEKDGSWVVRVFPNKFPAVVPYKKIISNRPFLKAVSAFGKHEVIIETPAHNKQLWDLSTDEIAVVLDVYKKRVAALSKVKGISYVSVFKNHGPLAGTSLIHSHTQVVAYGKIPNLVAAECKASIKKKKCLYCEIIDEEMQSDRRVYENKSFAAFCPYASRFNYEVWIFPKKHVTNITKLDSAELNLLADVLRKILLGMKKINCSYNFFLHISPKKENLHFHIEVCPRISTWAGFEISTDDIINSVSPEDAARFYRSQSFK